MLRNHSSPIHALLHRRGQMSTAAIVFLVLGIVFAAMVLVVAVLAALLYPAVQQARTAARTVQSKNNLKMIGLALHNYHDVYSTFPPGGIYTKQEEPYNAWMTSLLPYVEQASLFNQIDFNQPWSAPKNQMYFQSVLPVYLNPNLGPETNKVGNLGASHYSGNSQLLLKNRGLSFREILDGTSNTILAGEVSVGFKAWGDPDNRRDPADGFGTGPNQFGGPASGRGVVQMLMADGAVRVISENVDVQTLKALASPDGAEPVGEY